MAGEGDYFGYTSAQNTELQESLRLARRMGEDISHYPPPDDGGQYIEPTVNWSKPNFRDDQTEQAARSNDTIEKINKRIMAQDSSAVLELSDQWYRVVQVIDDIRARVLLAANGLKHGGDGSPGNKKGWTGDAADAFLARGPGATIKSLDDWRSAAVTNWLGTSTLAWAIPGHKSKMSKLYSDYKAAMGRASTEWRDEYIDGKSIDEANESQRDMYVTHLRQIEFWWSLEAQKIQYDMAKEYWSVMTEELNGGFATVYEGPPDAVQPNPDFITRAMMGEFGMPPNVSGVPNVGNRPAPKVKTPDVRGLQDRAVNTNALKEKIPDDVKKPDVTAPDVKTPAVDKPNVIPPTVAPPVLPPVPGNGQFTGTPPVVRPAPSLNNLGNNLLNNLPGQGQNSPSVLRPGASNLSAPGTGAPPSMPQSPMKGQPPPNVKGRGPGPNITAPPDPSKASPGTPGAPPGRGTPAAPGAPGRRGPGEGTPGIPRQPGQVNQFSNPTAPPSSPVLRAPRSEQTSQLPGFGRPTGARGPARSGSGGSPPIRSDAIPSVLSRPSPRQPAEPVLPPPGPARPRQTGDDILAPPPVPTSRPVVGRVSRPEAGPQQRLDASTGVLRSARQSGSPGYEAQLGSRNKQSDADQEFAKVRQLLDQEETWTVATPGGGVLDSTPTRSTNVTSEPKPTLGA
ncbi:hypothetical protein GCM10027290_67970 [Micromonospora sonneratiae]|uniref:PPE family protein n=1 Tax=Micromonospora sonneratiae TaxID=1184706 RepID=A0ABW3YL81_9ACTN